MMALLFIHTVCFFGFDVMWGETGGTPTHNVTLQKKRPTAVFIRRL